MSSICQIKDEFLSKFKESLNEKIVNPLFANEIRNGKSLTKFYKSDLFPKVAKEMNLYCSEKEFLRIDILLTKKGKYGFRVPIVAIESENIADGSNSDLDNEILKLFCINAPIKVLITRFENFENEINSIWEGHSNSAWYYSMADFFELGRFNGYFIVINAYWSEKKLTYSILTIDDNMVSEPVDNIVFPLE